MNTIVQSKPTETLKGSATVAPKTVEAKAPKIKQAKGTIGGESLARLIAANAFIVPMAASGVLHDRVISQLGGPVEAAKLNETVAKLVKGWDAFDAGYLIGKSASYGACAVIGSKKAKKSPAFCWAARGPKGPVLYTADGFEWSNPTGDRAVAAHALALSAVNTAFGAK